MSANEGRGDNNSESRGGNNSEGQSGNNTRRRLSEGILIALISTAGTVGAALVTGGFGLAAKPAAESPGASPTTNVVNTARPPATPHTEGASNSTPTDKALEAQPPTYLTDIDPANNDWNPSGSWEDEPVTIDGVDYDHGIRTKGTHTNCTFVREYALSRKYTSFRAVIGLTDDTPEVAPSKVRITLDGNPVRTVSTRLGKPVSVDLSVKDIVRLGMEVELFNCKNTSVGFGDPRLE